MGANVGCYFKILAFTETQFERERPHGGQTISAETLQTFAVFSKSPNLKKKSELHLYTTCGRVYR